MAGICTKCNKKVIANKKKQLCHKCYCAENYQLNKEIRKQKSKDYAVINSEYIKDAKQKYYFKNKERQRAYEKTEIGKRSTQNWRLKNKGLLCFHSNMRNERCKFSTPSWLNVDEIKIIYKNRPIGYSVDHIIPLVSKDICGLNVPWNMQYLTTKDNRVKYNKFDFTYDNISWQLDICSIKAA